MTDEEFLKPFRDWFNLPKGDQMNEYIVTWQAIVEAATPEDAALKAFRVMQDRNTTNTHVVVREANRLEGPASWHINVEDIPR